MSISAYQASVPGLCYDIVHRHSRMEFSVDTVKDVFRVCKAEPTNCHYELVRNMKVEDFMSQFHKFMHECMKTERYAGMTFFETWSDYVVGLAFANGLF